MRSNDKVKLKTYPLTMKGLEEMIKDLEKEGKFERLEKWLISTKKEDLECYCAIKKKK